MNQHKITAWVFQHLEPADIASELKYHPHSVVEGSDVPTHFTLDLCIHCLLTVWSSSRPVVPSEDNLVEEDTWEAGGFSECSTCRGRLDHMSPDVRMMFVQHRETALLLLYASRQASPWDRVGELP